MKRLQAMFLTVISLIGVPALAAPPGLLHAQTFTLEQAHIYLWTAERPAIKRGTIVVVQVDPEDAKVRQVGGPVLYVGKVPAERVNNGDTDGVVIAFVPGHVDLGITPIHWGPSTLPERVDAAAGADALAQARAQPAGAARLQQARAPALQLQDTAALYRHLADLIDAHAPGEAERARGYRAQRP
jgi:hypothetical protein